MPHTAEWRVRLHLFEDDDGTTKAHVVLDTGTTALTAHGTAHCHPADADVAEIGDELAAGRGLRSIAQQLLDIAERDIEGMGSSRPGPRQVTERSSPR
ncbi:dsRBD fold-containing protein [Streptomyces sp. NPDC032940]|uniref:dsRBD fold-containing protein n=1 Tax=Streptomyces sp. NPDC032940 TaxID=3155366 RepID=UPI0033E06147